jgi:hypothetical protein
VLNVYTREGIIVRDLATSRSIYGTWNSVLEDIKMDFFKHVIIKVY